MTLQTSHHAGRSRLVAMRTSTTALVLLLLLFLCSSCTRTTTHAFATRRAIMTMKRGRASFQKQVSSGAGGSNASNSKGGMPNSVQSMSGDGTSSARSSNKAWIPVTGSIATAQELEQALAQNDNKVVLMDTMVPALQNSATNPTGAVAVVKYGGNKYCLSAACASCKFPLTKARVLPPNDETNNEDARLACDFCSATYNVRTGERVESVTKGGLLGGVVKGLFSSQQQEKFPVYELGESKDGKVVINLG